MRLVLASLLLITTPLASAAAQETVGSGVEPSSQRNSAERTIGFAAAPPAGAALVVLLASAEVPAGLPLAAAERAALTTAIAGAGFTGKANEALSLRAIGERPRLVAVGTGAQPAPSALQEAAGKAAQELKGENAPVAVIGASGASTAADAALGYALGQYRFDRYKTGGTPPPTQAVTVVATDPAQARAAWDARHSGVALGARLARNLINEPAGVIHPASFVERTREAVGGIEGVSIEVLDEAAMRRLGMGAIVGVGQGSRRGSRLLLVTYRGTSGAPLALVGKGITFDSGGISLKPGLNMGQMKADMSGAAAVVGAVLALARTGAPVHVIGVAALAENMPGGNAQRPGDVVRTMGGKTIEVVNTDAEGRLVLADAVQYVVERRKPFALVDIATLTGAVGGALGDEYAGLFASDEALAAAILAAGEASGEPLWRLPLHPNHDEDIKSKIADVRNSTEGLSPGASHGAAFIGAFVDRTVPWAHIDMAGVMWATTAKPLYPEGPTGYGVRLLDALARTWRAP